MLTGFVFGVMLTIFSLFLYERKVLRKQEELVQKKKDLVAPKFKVGDNLKTVQIKREAWEAPLPAYTGVVKEVGETAYLIDVFAPEYNMTAPATIPFLEANIMFEVDTSVKARPQLTIVKS